MRVVLTRVLVATAAVVALLAPAPPASAAARVMVANSDGAAVIDPTYATTVTVRGSGFQSIKGGHGGIYVFFGTVKSGWRPSQGGVTGQDYFYVPDSEAKNNQGYQRFIAFPGSDTASSAAGTMSADGSWSTTLVVPGATFQALDRNGRATTIDCRKVTCGVITVGAHGVANAHNESFSPVRVADLYAETGGPSPTADPTTAASAPSTGAPSAPAAPDGGNAAPQAAAPAELEVDRASAHPGSVLAFAATGLAAGGQVSAVLDDGAAGAGPFLVGADGGVAGVLTIPAETEAGTHELRLFGVSEPPSISFAVTAAEDQDAVPVVADVAAEESPDRWAVGFAIASAVVLLLALLRLARTRRGARSG